MTSDISCPMRPGPCRHASINYEPVRIPRFKMVGTLQVPAGEQVELRPNPKGIFCNCDGTRYVSELQVCPLVQSPPPLKSTGQQEIGAWL